MLLTLTTTRSPATDLGYLLYKHPDRLQTFTLPFGQAHVFYPEASPTRCTAALLLEIDPIQLVRGRRGSDSPSFALQAYVNDRPYAASSFLSVAIAQVYGSALAGQCKDRPELAETALPLVATLSVLPCRGGEDLLQRLFKPLGYSVRAWQQPLDAQFPEWGSSPAFRVELSAEKRLKDVLTHLYVLVPVLDNNKHYFVGEDEVDKLMARGEGWLGQHPERELIVKRYLRYRHHLTESALEQLREEDAAGIDARAEQSDLAEESLEQPLGLNQQRLDAVAARLKASGARRVVDLGCGEGKLLAALLPDPQFQEIIGMDVSSRSLAGAERRLQLERLPEAMRARLKLIQGSLLYRDARLQGCDAASLVEVIEHLEPDRLGVMEQVVFAAARPGTVIITTPNREYNRLWPGLPGGAFRHPDHHFEWTRAEFRAWAERVAGAYGYALEFQAVGPQHAEVGAPTQMAVFTRQAGAV